MTEAPVGPPGGPSYGPTNAPPPTYLAWAIVSTALFCLPLGVVSIVFASQVNAKYYAGDYAGAQRSSHKAWQWALWSTILGVVSWVAIVALLVLGLLAGSTTSTSY